MRLSDIVRKGFLEEGTLELASAGSVGFGNRYMGAVGWRDI